MTKSETTSQSAYENQMAREARDRAEAVELNKARRKAQAKFGGLSSTAAGQKLKEEALEGVIDEINLQIAERKAAKGGAIPIWWNAIDGLDVGIVAETALIVCLDAVGSNWSWNATQGYAGNALHTAVFYSKFGDRKGKKLLASLEDKSQKRCTRYTDRVEYVLAIAKKRGWVQDKWTKDELAQIGSWMIDVAHLGSGLIEVTDVKDDDKPHPRGKKTDWPENKIVLTEKAQAIMDEHNTYLDGFSTKFSPMTFPPTDWPSVLSPYLDPMQSFQVPMVKKVWSQDAERKIAKALDDGSMRPCVDAINIIQSVPLNINDYVVGAIRWAGDQSKSAGMRWRKLKKYPNLDPVIVPPKPDTKKMVAEGLKSKQRQLKWKNYYKQKKRKSLRSAGIRLLSQTFTECESLAGYDFYLPHQFDKRGRLYHTSYFGHHNADYIRACFLFARKTPITEDGKLYLCLQLANTYGNGVDKFSLDQRVQWVKDEGENIYDAGADFSSDAAFAFWSGADEPFQFLAACHEYKNLVDAEQRGEVYSSGLPVAIDATQSGIQHYACSMLDEKDGKLVNLFPSKTSDLPEDVYDACRVVAQQLIDDDIARWQSYTTLDPEDGDSADVKDDKERGRKYLQCALDLRAIGGLTRKIVKRNVMTWVYSSRQYGMAKQLRDDWLSDFTEEVDRGEREVHPFGDDEGFMASFYIAGRNETAIARVVNSADNGMRFFQRCAALLRKENKHFEFITPLGFPMHQFYREELMKVKMKDGKPVLDDNGNPVMEPDPARQRVYLSDKITRKPKKGAKNVRTRYTDAVDASSIRAVAPNVIHAMDATHLMMTVIECFNEGVEDMMVVHDSFATTIGNAATMSSVVRSTMVHLYENTNLYQEIREQVAARLERQENIDALPNLPEEGGLDLTGIYASQYCFS